MAFNPFRRFRKHQKTLLAAVTILSMISFIVLGGYGEMARLGAWFAKASYWVTGKSRFPQVATLYGQHLDQQEAYAVMVRREVANRFMEEAIGRSHFNVLQQVKKETAESPPKEPEKDQNGFEAFMMMRNIVSQLVPQLENMALLPPNPQNLETLRAWDQICFEQLHRLSAGAGQAKKADEARQLERLLGVIRGQYRRASPPRGEVYFGGRLDGRGIVDFLLWRHEADRLGIELTPEDLSRLVHKHTLGQLSGADLAQMENGVLGRFRNVVSADFLEALGDEFRVELAKTALLGYDPETRGAGRQAVTPYKFWQFYLDSFTQSSITLLPVPVDRQEFLAKVPVPADKKAFDKELKAFFKKYAGQEDNPAAPTPGFKQPPRIQVEWVSASADAPYYRRQAARGLRLAEAAAQVANSSRSVGGPAALAAGASVPVWLSKQDAESWQEPAELLWTDAGYLYSINATKKGAEQPAPASRVEAPEAAAATVGELLGAGATGAAVLPALATHEVAASASGARQVAGPVLESAAWLELSAALAGGHPVPLAPAALWHHLERSEQFLPEALVKDRVLQRTRHSLAQQLVEENFKKLREEIELRAKLRTAEEGRAFLEANQPTTIRDVLAAVAASSAAGNPPLPGLVLPAAMMSHAAALDHLRLAGALVGMGPSPLGVGALQAVQMSPPVDVIRQPIERAVASGEFDHGATDRAHDPFTITDKHSDRGLKALWDAYRASSEEAPDPEGRNFARLFFEFPQPSQPGEFQASFRPIDLYAPQKTLVAKDASFLYWSTAEQPAYEPTFAEVRAKVAKRWQLEKARTFAEEEAQRLAAQAGKAGGDGISVLRDVLAGHPLWGRLIEVNGVRRLVALPPSEASAMGGGMSYRPWPVNEKDLPVEYPADDFVTRLLTLKKKGETVVVHDRPRAVYYVAVLAEERFPPAEHEFRNAYLSRQDHDSLLQWQASTVGYGQQRKKAVLEQLKQDARLEFDEEAAASLKPGEAE